MKYSKLSALSLSVITALLAGGCSSSHTGSFSDVHGEAVKLSEPTISDLKRELKPRKKTIGQEFTGQHYVDPNDYEISYIDERDLPTVFNEPAHMIVENKNEVSLDVFAAHIYDGYRVVIDVSDPNLKETGSDEAKFTPAALGTGINADTTGPVQPFAGDTEENETKSDLIKLKPFEFGGTLKELLDYVSVLNNFKWKYDEETNKIFFVKYEIETFYIYDFANQRNMEERVTTQTQQEGGDVTGGNQSQFEQQEQITPWQDIQGTVNSMVGDNGSAAFDRKNGLVTVLSSDYILSRVGRYVKELNDLSTTEVSVAFHMIRVKVNESNAKSINVNYLNNLISGDYAIEAGMGILSPNIVDNASTLSELTQGNFLQASDGTFSALFGFLNNVGSATISAFDHVDILNNEYYTKSSTENQEYISSIEREQSNDSSGEDLITTETDVAVDGINIRIKPRVIGDRVQIEYGLSNSTFDGFVDAGLGTGLEGVKLQNNSGFAVSHKAIVRNGQTRVVLATAQEDKTSSSQGPWDHNFWMFGGNENDSTDKEVTIITVTAYYDN
jgi:hypothetical protein